MCAKGYDGGVRWLGWTLGLVLVGCGPKIDSVTSSGDDAGDDTSSAGSTSGQPGAEDGRPQMTTTPRPDPADGTRGMDRETTSVGDATTVGPLDTGGGDAPPPPCMTQDWGCLDGCGVVYDCGVLTGCMFTGAEDERLAFIDRCSQNPLCDAAVQMIDNCDCPGTIETFSELSPEFVDACENGL